jgi:hypothetical protein
MTTGRDLASPGTNPGEVRYYVAAMGGEIGASSAPSPPVAPTAGVPLLPGGTSVFDDLPVKAIVIGPLAPAIGDGLIVVRNHANAGTGLFLVRDGEVVETHCIEADGRVSGEAAARRIKAWKEATVSARRMGPAVVAVVPPLILGDPAFSDLRLDWIKWPELLDDVRSQTGTFVIEVITPSGRGVTCIRDGEHIATYTEAHPELGDRSLLDEVAASGTGTVRVLRDPASEAVPRVADEGGDDEAQTPGETDDEPAAPPPRESDAPFAPPEESIDARSEVNGHAELDGAPYEYTPQAPHLVDLDSPPTEGVPVAEVLPELKLLVRDRLHKSSMRLEILLEEAATWDRSVESVVDEVRRTSIRGVQQSTLDDLADQMLALGGRRSTY